MQDKEQELRDFIRNFEHRIRETESTNAKVSSERERERWSLLKHAREESERSLALAAQLNARDIQLQRIQEQLQEVCALTFCHVFFRYHSIHRLVASCQDVCQIKKVCYHSLH